MAPKRPSNGSSSGRAPKKGKTGEELADQVEKEKETIAGLPFWNLLMDDVDDMFQSFGTVTDFFMATYPTFAERKKLTEMLMTHFGSGENVLSSDFTPGIKSFALWQVCYHVEAGNKGLVINEYMKNLIKLVIIYGPKTDASCQAGVEYPVIQALVPSYFDSPWETECVDASTYQSQSVGFTKGWTRGLAFLYVAHMIIKHDLVDHYKKELPKAYANFCLLKGMVTADFASELDRINANRDLTMGTVMTRAKPNCFNALHQLSRRLKQGEKLSAIVANFDNKGPKSVCGLGASESGALVNLVHHLPLECRSIFGRAVAEFGIVKGPVTHAALAALALRVGFQPELVGDDWSVSMRNTEESVIRASKRLVDDFRSAPPGLRKSATANDVAKMARISRAFDLVLAELSSQLPMPAFEAEKAHVINLFEKRVFDDWLFSLSEECPAQIDVSKISELQGIIGKHKASAEQEALQKSKALHLQVQTATFQKLVSDLDQDTEALTKWVEAEKKRKSSWQGMVLTHTRKRYVRGLDNVRRFAGDNLRMVQGPLTSAEMELAEFRSSLEWTADRKCLPDQRFMLMVLDMSVPPNLTDIDDLVRSCGNLLHQSANNALLVILPRKYSGQTVKSNLAALRRIEDAILANGLNMEVDIALHLEVEGMHGNDRRPLSARCRLCVSDKIPEGASSWLSSNAARGKLADVPLMRIKEMKRLQPPNHIGESVEAYSLSPAERCQQKGVKAAAKIIESLVEGTVLQSPEYRLDIVEFNLQAVPDWVEATWYLKYTWESNSSKPRVSYFGIARDLSVHKAVTSHMEAILMQEWWENHPEAGPKEPDNSSPCDKPTLSLTSWEGEIPTLPEVVVCKFDGDDTYGGKWGGKVAAFRDFVNSSIAPIVRRSVSDGGGSDSGPGALSQDGPDMTVGDQAPVVADVVFDAVAKADFNHADVLFTVKAVRHLPAVFVMKNYDIFIALDEAIHKSSSLQLEPLELLGFNVGEVVPSEGGDPNYVIFWNFRSDVDNVTVVKGSDKMTMTLAEARFKALKDHSIPDLGIQGHVVEPLKIEKEGQQVEAFMRCTVQPNLRGGKIHYAPTALTDAQMAEGSLKRAACGACFLGRLSKLNSLVNAKIIWDVQLKVEPPAIVKGLKPKLHLVSRTKLEKDFFYKLT